jgi:ferredoxin-type protein NapG
MNSSIGRRDLFKLGGRKVADIASQLATAKAARRAEGWVRPPFALDELDFLLNCTRCGKCIEACPHDVLFELPASAGRHAAGTPAMELLQHGCHLCTGWPCVAACAPGSLKLPEGDADQPPAAPKFAVARIDQTACLPFSGPECGACAGSCPIPGALDWEGGVRPVIDQEICTGCALCREACILDPKAIQISVLVPNNKTALST